MLEHLHILDPHVTFQEACINYNIPVQLESISVCFTKDGCLCPNLMITLSHFLK